MASPTTDQFHRAILNAMAEQTQLIIDEEAKKAAANVETRVRAMAGQIATKIASWVQYETDQNNLTITVRLPDRDAQ